MAFNIESLLPARMNDWELVTELATLGFISGSETSRQALEAISTMKICHELYHRLNSEDKRIVVLRAQTINNVAEYVKKNPRASEKELSEVLKKEIQIFAVKVAQLN